MSFEVCQTLKLISVFEVYVLNHCILLSVCFYRFVIMEVSLVAIIELLLIDLIKISISLL